MPKPTDGEIRARALDAARSFIVQAPAGSGKTELLIQRYLLLLGRVQYPEQIVAVTFTRKAAAEMRSRVLEILEQAAEGNSATPAHRRRTIELAGQALERDRQQGWQLLERSGRLRIETVDALNGWLAEQLPVASGGMAGAAVLEDPAAVYRRAAVRMLEAALSDAELRTPAAALLAAADNSFERLARAIAAVIPLRDQWLHLLGITARADLVSILSAAIARLAGQRVAAMEAELEPDQREELRLVLEHVARFREPAGAVAGDVSGDADIVSGDVAVAAADLWFWRQAATCLLTERGAWRRRLTKREGFYPEHKEVKARATALLEALEARPAARDALLAVASVPSPIVTSQQVDRIADALTLLRHTVAELKVIFQQEHAVDFLELALGAQSALGALEAPSELMLAIDRRIEHLLVDEFQDTSHSQFRLLEQLTSGWTEGDGRTLFLVGDPMQSIYRFRDADMSLFLRAKSEGIGGIRLENLVLGENFRSAPAIVDWVNSTFAGQFPAHDQPESGRAAYHPFASTRPSASDDGVMLHRIEVAGLAAQHSVVAALAAQYVSEHGGATTAVLVQSRNHLKGLRRILEESGVPVRAVELDTLAEQPAIQDLLALARALLHPSDRIAWLALLRAPWCGLGWSDLEAIVAGEPERSIPDLLADEVALDRLSSDEARARAAFLGDRIRLGLRLRGRYPLAQWIECCWQLLDGPATLEDQAVAEQTGMFFAVLAQLAREGDIADTAELAEALEIPFSGGGNDTAPGEAPMLEIMTIHRAKGLEFDTVILFGLERRVRGSGDKLIYWHSSRSAAGTIDLLVGAVGTPPDPLTRYLQSLDRDLDREERGRLLYVAVTRARRRLHLIAHVENDDAADRSSSGTLLWWLREQFRQAVPCARPRATSSVTAPTESEWFVTPLIALDPDPAAPLGPLASDMPPENPEQREFEWAGIVAAHIGTVVHRSLQRVAESLSGGDLGDALTADARRCAQELRLLGVPREALRDATERVRDILGRVASDTFGRWILASHENAESEYELAVIDGGHVRHVRIDRTFVDTDGVRWIIDYKTSRHTGGDLEVFLDSEELRYREQLETYAAAMHELDPRPIRVGLYFPLLNVFRDWAPSADR